jgi:nicotinamidase-related amidase
MKTALLIIDMQTFFAEMVRDSTPQVLALSEHFRKNQLPQFFTQHGHSKEELSGKVPNQLVRKWGAGGSIAIGSDDWQLIPEVEKAWTSAGNPDIVAKNTYDAFINTNLEERLRELGIERVVVVGVMTDCCCDTTARSAFNRGFETWLVSDACGSANKTQHRAGLQGFGFAFGEVLDTVEVRKRL